MQAILLAGGLGTRLREAVKDIPKPMAPVKDKPFLHYLIQSLKRGGITHIIMAVGYKGDVIEAYFKDGRDLGIKISYAYEKELLGTAGAIKNAACFIKDEYFFVLNADTYYDMDYQSLHDLAVKEQFDMTLVLRKAADVSRYGKVILKGNQVTGFNEKQAEPGDGMINGGVYVMHDPVLKLIPDRKCSLENEIIPALLTNQGRVGGLVSDKYFIDIGIPSDYYRFIEDVKRGEIAE